MKSGLAFQWYCYLIFVAKAKAAHDQLFSSDEYYLARFWHDSYFYLALTNKKAHKLAIAPISAAAILSLAEWVAENMFLWLCIINVHINRTHTYLFEFDS